MKKLIFAAIIAVLILAAFYFWNDEFSPEEIIATFVGSGGYILAVWKWISEEEVKKDFREETGIKYSTFKRIKI